MNSDVEYPNAIDPGAVGSYTALAKAGGGHVWDAVLEYRVWCHPDKSSTTEQDYYRAFATYREALDFSQGTREAEPPLALILQEEFIDEPEPGRYVHVKQRRITEWPVEFLTRPRRTAQTIPDFLSPDAPSNRLDILRGLAP